MEKYKQYIGFHGTNIVSATKILKENNFHPSTGDDEWLGKGIYFFAYPEDAEWWCSSYKRLKKHESVILRVEIEAESVIDLLGSKADIDAFKDFCDVVKDKCPRLPNGEKRSNYMSLAIKILMKDKNYRRDMIIGGFEQNRHLWYREGTCERRKFPLVVAQVQYCIYNHDCIKSISCYRRRGGES